MDAIKKNENFFVTGVGTGIVTGEHGKLGLIHLQNMSLELSSEMEKIVGGESSIPVYTYQKAKNGTAKFTNASMSLDVVNATQGTQADNDVVLFTNEQVYVGSDGSLPLTHLSTADMATLTVYGDNDAVIEVKNGKVATSFAGKKVGAVYAYTVKTGAIGTSVKTTSVPGYVQIFHRSNPVKQKNGRIVRYLTTIYKARCNGSLTINMQHDAAMAPELSFDLVDPERKDGKFLSVAVVDVADGEGEVVAHTDDVDIKDGYVVGADVDKVADAPSTSGGTGDTGTGDTGTNG